MKTGKMVEYIVCVGGKVVLGLIYVPVFDKFVKVFPSSNDSDEFQPNIIVFDGKKGREIIKNYENLRNAIIIVREFRGIKDYSNVRVNDVSVNLNRLLNGQRVAITS